MYGYMNRYGDFFYYRVRYGNFLDVMHRYWNRYLLDMMYRNRNGNGYLLDVMYRYVHLLHMMMVNRVHFVRHMNHDVFTKANAIIVYVMLCIFIFIKLHLLTLYTLYQYSYYQITLIIYVIIF